MLLLGVGLVYSRNNNSHALIKRGCIIFLSAYALNFIRDFIPYSILAFLQDDPSYKIEAWDSLWYMGMTFNFKYTCKRYIN